ncbi:beta-propeller fold lactonase family protein [Janibacter limosus]
MVRVQRLTGELTPKSVVASPSGPVFAQNMMYTHTVSAFTADGALHKTISDAVDLSDFGVKGHPGTSKGAPVEMAFSPDGKTAWVSNYSMYGRGFEPEGKDACVGPEGISDSYLYKIDTASLKITDVVRVGAVPKYVAATHDGSKVLVTNWCSMDMDVVDTKTNKVTETIQLPGKHPRGIAISPDDKVAYVAIMGSDETVKVDLGSGEVVDFADTGDGPRHLLVSPDGSRLYVSNNGSGTVSEVDAATGKTLREAKVGSQPRSMAISPDGGALYIGNYASSTVSKIATKDFEVVQTEQTDGLPIGITYEPTKKRVWVASYGGSIVVFDDSHAA